MNTEKVMSVTRPSKNEPKIITRHDPPPIPIRCFDWTAVTENYDGAPDAKCPIGFGATEAEAIEDLQEQLEWRREAILDHYHLDH
jgi:hypothetical protein